VHGPCSARVLFIAAVTCHLSRVRRTRTWREVQPALIIADKAKVRAFKHELQREAAHVEHVLLGPDLQPQSASIRARPRDCTALRVPPGLDGASGT
jgi:hypothetical protein